MGVSEHGDTVEVRIDLCRVAAAVVAAGVTGLPSRSLRPDDVERDLSADRLRWRLRPCGREGEQHEKEDEKEEEGRWMEVLLPGPVDTATAQAKWMRAHGPKGPDLLLTAT